MQEAPKVKIRELEETPVNIVKKVAVMNFSRKIDRELYEWLHNLDYIEIYQEDRTFDRNGAYHIVVFYGVPEDKFNEFTDEYETIYPVD